jgi:hypothetical protein
MTKLNMKLLRLKLHVTVTRQKNLFHSRFVFGTIIKTILFLTFPLVLLFLNFEYDTQRQINLQIQLSLNILTLI